MYPEIMGQKLILVDLVDTLAADFYARKWSNQAHSRFSNQAHSRWKLSKRQLYYKISNNLLTVSWLLRMEKYNKIIKYPWWKIFRTVFESFQIINNYKQWSSATFKPSQYNSSNITLPNWISVRMLPSNLPFRSYLEATFNITVPI